MALKTPILFVHGSNLTGATWQAMLEAFARAGYPRDYLLAVEMVPRDGDNIRAATLFIVPAVRELLEKKTKLLANHGCEATDNLRIDIVSHSMGAISSRWYAKQIAPENTRTLITISGANHGTYALCGSNGAGDIQLCPDESEESNPNTPLSLLNGTPSNPIDESPYGSGTDLKPSQRILPTESRRIRYFTIRIDPDDWIVPADSAVLDGSDFVNIDAADFPLFIETSPGNFQFLGDTAHDDLPADPNVIRFVLHLLS